MKFTGSPSNINSGENLVNFINNVSSCVKTVLSKPGCFKRNTNHRRFLQKQLRQSVQDNVSKTATTNNESSATPKTKKDSTTSNTTKDIAGENNVKGEPASPKSENEDRCGKPWKQKTIRKRRRYNPLRASPPHHSFQAPPTPQPLPMVPPLIPSPTGEYSPEVYTPMAECEQYIMVDLNENYEQLRYRGLYNDEAPQYRSASMNYSSAPIMTSSTPMQQLINIPYSKKSQASQCADEDFALENFLSGEDLMRNLEFGDLFIPDYSSETSEQDLAYRSYIAAESERQIQYLAQLEALEACYQNDLFLHSLTSDC